MEDSEERPVLRTVGRSVPLPMVTRGTADFDSASGPDLVRLIEESSTQDRLKIASREDAPPHLQEALAEAADIDLARLLAVNYSLDESTLARIAERFEILREIISLNPNAPIEMMEQIPIGSHSALAVEHYLDARGATVSQKRFVWQEYRSSPHPGGSLLRDVWSSASTTE